MDQSAETGAVAEDPVDDAAWAAITAAGAGEGPPDWLFPEEHPPDPDSGDDGWGEDFAAAAAQAEADGADDAGWRETLLNAGIGTGWAHYPGAPPVPGVHGGPGGGFGQGQAHDTAAPEPRLAALADDAAGPGRDFGGVDDDALMGLIGARSRLSSRQAWELLTALAELIRRRPAPYCGLEGDARLPRVWAEGTSAEVSVQLAVTQRAATRLLGLAYDLAAKLPRTSAALRDGVLDQDKADTVASWCATLDGEQARAAEDLLFAQDGIETMTWTMIRDRIGRAVLTVDPDAARKRRVRGTRDACVETKLELSGNMQIAAREIPPASALAVDRKLTDRARELKKSGVKGSMSRLRVLAYLERWGITDPFPAPGDPDTDPDDHETEDQDGDGQDGDWPEDWPQDDGRDHHPGDDPPGDDRPRDDRPGDDGPDDGNGDDGPDDSGNGDDGSDDSGPGDGGNGGPGGNGPGSRPGGSGSGPCGGGCACGGTPPAGTGTGTGAGGTGAGDGMAGWLHLTVPASTLLEHGDRAGQLSKLGPVDADLARSLAGQIAGNGQSVICVTVTGPDGRPVAHACGKPARGDPARPAGKRRRDPPGDSPPQDPVPPALTPLRPAGPGAGGGPAGQPGYGTWRLSYAGRDLDLTFEPLDGQCDHRHESPGHDPGKHLKHLTAVLNQDCTLRTCRTPEHRSDYEHARPSGQGGRTCLCNGHPCCRHDHRSKQAPGWHVEGTGQPGHFTWTLPSGRSYPSKPTSYPT
jgi:Domain of unknown function (DUF222)